MYPDFENNENGNDFLPKEPTSESSLSPRDDAEYNVTAPSQFSPPEMDDVEFSVTAPSSFSPPEMGDIEFSVTAPPQFSPPEMGDAEHTVTTPSQYSSPSSAPVFVETSYAIPQQDGSSCNPPAYGETAYNPPQQDIPSYCPLAYEDETTYTASNQGTPPYITPTYDGTTHTAPSSYSGQNYVEPNHIQTEQASSASGSPQEAPWNMYSPNVFTNQPYQREDFASTTPTQPTATPQKAKSHKKGVGRFFRAACLVIICSLFSAAAAFAVIEYRTMRGDFTVSNQVFLGAPPVTETRPEPTPAPLIPEQIAAVGEDMTAEAIYEMALTQVVGISIPAPGFGGSIESEFDAPSMPATGSGFIISSDGYILTNYHVIEFASFHDLPVSVTMFDGSTYDAQIIGFDPDNDVALLKIDATDLNPVLIGSSNDLRVGQRVYAIGNPFGDLLYTMTDGIVSALDRVVTVEGRSINFFQTSAAVNRGNSGGPVYNTRGEVVGVVTAKVIRGDAEGIGFAIPINDAIEIATELIEHGYLAGRPLIGITGQSVTSGQADYFGWVVGTYIRSIVEGSAAEVAGLQVGDIITAIGDMVADTMDELRAILRTYSAGDTTTITVWRQGGDPVDIDDYPDVASEGEYIIFPITFDEDMHAGVPRQQRP